MPVVKKPLPWFHAFSPAVAAEFQWRTVSSVSTGCSVLILTCLVRGDEAYHPPNRLVGLRRTVVSDIRAERPDWQLFRDGCPGGESPQQVVARALIRSRALGHGRCLDLFQWSLHSHVREPLAWP